MHNSIGRYVAIVALALGLECFTAHASPSNALDRIDFGNAASEDAHNFEPNTLPSNMPTAGTGSYGFTYRQPVGVGDGTGSASGSQSLIFTMACDPNRQNYLSIKLWGNDTPCSMVLNNDASQPGYGSDSPQIELLGGPAVYPNRFFYYTVPIPISQTQGVTSVSLNLYFPGLAPAVACRPIYSAFTHTAPCFVPASSDVVGSAPTITGQATLGTLTNAQVVGTTSSPGILLTNRNNIYNNTGTASNPTDYYDQLLIRQVLPGTYETGTTPVPPEVVGLDLFVNLSSWAGNGHTDDQWRDQIAERNNVIYTGFPEELMSALTASYLVQPFVDQNGNTVTGLDRYHGATGLQRIVSVMDGCSYEQGIDGGFPAWGSQWIGVTSSPRGPNEYNAFGQNIAGSTSRQVVPHGGGALEGINCQTLGWSIIQMLNDPNMPASGGTGNPQNFIDYLNQSYNPDLGVTGSGTFSIASGTMLRAYAYERMLYEHLVYSSNNIGGLASQSMFNGIDSYATYVALEKLLALFPNSTYSNYNSVWSGYNAAQVVLGIIPTQSPWGGLYTGVSGLVNYNMTPGGLGEASGALSCGFDGGGYGQFLPYLAPRIAQMGTWDPNAAPSVVSSMKTMANATINAFNQFLFPTGNATITNGTVTSDTFTFSQEDFITYRAPGNPNGPSGQFDFNPQFGASDPNGGINNPYALRAAYLCTQYGLTPGYVDASGSGGSIGYLRDLTAYESTLRSLININPTSLTPLPGEPGQPDYAWADTRAGTVAFVNHSERFYMNSNYRTFSGNWSTVVPSSIALIDDITPTIQRAARVYMPYNSATVQPDGNLGGGTMYSPYVVSYGNYVLVMNNGTTAYSATLPSGYGQAEELLSKNFYNLGSTVPVPAGQSAIFWLAASSTEPTGANAPTLMTAAAASTTVVTGSTVNLSVLGAPNNGDSASNLNYTWSLASGPDQVAYSANGTNAAQNTSVTFTQAGVYNFQVVVTDSTNGQSVVSTVPVTVNQILTSVGITPGSVTLAYGQIKTFFGAGYDQFGEPMQTPVNFSWSMSSGTGSINSVGYYVSAASGSGGSDVVKATAGSLSATTTVTLLPPGSLGALTSSMDVGAVGIPGSASYASGIYTIKGSGTDIWNQTDQFRYAFVPLTGDGTVTARVVSFQNNAGPSKAGVMFRNTLCTDSAYVDNYYSGGGQILNEYRTCTTSNATNAYSSGGVTLPYWVRLTRTGNSFTGYFSPDGNTWTKMGTESVPMNQTVYVGLAVCSWNNSQLATATFDNVSVNSVSHNLLSYDQDIATSAVGSYVESGSVATITGEGALLYGTSDNLNYAYDSIAGNGSITARVVSETNVNGFTKAGVMIRNSVASGSANVLDAVTPTTSIGIAFQWRTSNNGATSQTNLSGGSYEPPYWVQLTRSGNTFTAKCAPDNSGTPGTWTQQGSPQTITGAATTMLFGLAVCPQSTTTPCTAVFDHITVTGTTDPGPTIATAASAGSVSGSGTVALSVAGADSASGASTLTYTWNVVGEPPAPVSFSANGTNAASSSTATFTANGIYYLQATVANAVGQTVTSAIIPVTVGLTPVIPSGLAVSASGYNQVALSWTPSAFASSYNVERSTTSGSGYVTIGSPSRACFTDTGLVSGTTYYYVVTAVSSAGTSAASSQISATVAPPPPGLVTGLSATPASTQVSLSWTSATDATSYSVQRSTTSGGPYTVVGSPASTSYTDTGLSSGTTYYYVVAAVNVSGTSANSTQASPITLPVAPTGLSAVASSSTNQITLSWTGPIGAASYNILSSTTSGGPYTTIATGVTTTSYTHTGLAGGTTYYYVVAAVDASGASPNSAEASALTLPAAPTGLSAAANSEQVTLTWSATTGATSYKILSSTSSGGPYTPIASGITTTSYTNTGLTNGTTNYYVIAAVDATGVGANSSQVSAMPAMQNLYWDAVAGTSGLVNGSGNWDINNTAIWASSVSGNNPLLTFLNDDNAYFETAGTMTATIANGTTIEVGSVNQLANGTAATITGGALQIDTNSGVTNGVGSGNQALTIASAIVLNSSNVTINNATTAGSITLSGAISQIGSGSGITKTGAGTVVLSGANTYSGATTVSTGPLVLAANSTNTSGGVTSALSNSSSELVLAANSTLELLGNTNNTIFEPASAAANSQTNGVYEATGSNGPFNFIAGNNGSGTGNTLTLANFGQFGPPGTTPTFNFAINNNYTLQLGSGVLGTAALQVFNPTTINSTVAGGTVSIPGGINLNHVNAYALTLGGAGNISIGGYFQDGTGQNATLTSNSTGTVTLTGVNTYNGATTINSGTLIIGGAGQLQFGSYAGAIANAGTFIYNSTAAQTLSGAISGAGTLTISGTGTLTLSGANTNTGGTSISAGTLALGANNALSSSGAINVNGGTLSLTTFSDSVGAVTLTNGSITGTTGVLTGTSYGVQSGTISGILSGTGIALTKTTSGTVTLSGTNTYTGATTVSAGTLWINGSTASGSAVSAASGATLGGTGTINGATTISNGGILAPGNGGASTLTFAGGLSLNGGSSLNLGLGTSSSAVVMTAGTYTAPSSGTVTLNISSLTGFGDGTYTLITGATGISASSFTLSAPSGYTYTLSASSGTLSLTVSAPSAPTGLAVDGFSGANQLSWSGSNGSTSYSILRSTNGGSYSTLVSGLTGTTYTDNTAVNGTSYSYEVAASNLGGTSLASTAASVTTADPVAYLKFDEGTGTTTADATGNGWTGTLINTPTWVVGRSANAVELNGTNQYITLPTGVVSALTNCTITMWANLDAAPTWSRLFDFGTGTNDYMFLSANAGTIRFAITINGNRNEQQINGTTTFPIGGWHHVALTLAGAVGTLYVDGTQVGQNTDMTLHPSSLGSTNLNYIGHSQYSGDPYLNGVVDEFRIYNSALTSSQITSLIANSPPGLQSAPTSLTATAGSKQVALAWTAAAAATGYDVLRATASGGPYTTVATGVTTTSYTDTGLTTGTTYYYTIMAFSGTSESPNSNQANATAQ